MQNDSDITIYHYCPSLIHRRHFLLPHSPSRIYTSTPAHLSGAARLWRCSSPAVLVAGATLLRRCFSSNLLLILVGTHLICYWFWLVLPWCYWFSFSICRFCNTFCHWLTSQFVDFLCYWYRIVYADLGLLMLNYLCYWFLGQTVGPCLCYGLFLLLKMDSSLNYTEDKMVICYHSDCPFKTVTKQPYFILHYIIQSLSTILTSQLFCTQPFSNYQTIP